MKRALITRLSTGHYQATIKDGDAVAGSRIVGSPGSDIDTVAAFVKQHFDVSSVAVHPNCKLTSPGSR